MDKTRIITFRLDEERLQQLDDFTSTHSYWKRSFIICAVLDAFFRLTTAGTRFNIIRAAFERKRKYEITISEIKEQEENK